MTIAFTGNDAAFKQTAFNILVQNETKGSGLEISVFH